MIKTVRSSKPAGTVVNQTPVAGTSVNPNSTVVLDVSGGGTTVQSVVGYPAARAKSILQSQGFQVKEVENCPDPRVPLPARCSAEPAAARTVATPGSTITI